MKFKLNNHTKSFSSFYLRGIINKVKPHGVGDDFEISIFDNYDYMIKSKDCKIIHAPREHKYWAAAFNKKWHYPAGVALSQVNQFARKFHRINVFIDSSIQYPTTLFDIWGKSYDKYLNMRFTSFENHLMQTLGHELYHLKQFKHKNKYNTKMTYQDMVNNERECDNYAIQKCKMLEFKLLSK